MTLRPVVAGAALAENEVVGAEEATEGTRANRVHGSRLEIDKDGTGDILVRADLVVVHVDPLELKVVVALVQTIRLNAVLVRDDLPELGTFDACQRLELVIAGNREDIPIWLPHCKMTMGSALVLDASTSKKRVPGRSGCGRFHAYYKRDKPSQHGA